MQARALSRWIGIGGAFAAAAAIAAPQVAFATTSGQWTSPSLTITTSRLGAVHTGMTVRQASRAAGVQLTTAGDGQYSSPLAPGLMLELGWGPQSCVAATVPAHVHTEAGIHLGSTLDDLRTAYGQRLHWHSGSAGFSDPRSWFIQNSAGYLFFHMSDVRHGHVVRIGAGTRLRDSYC
jgi:hypothetical protein